ncbi:tetratricopeptide repeat protein [Microbacterium sp. C7(2022)]|uniref:tetratricopeptide repeat protein n=1 Tax=Microbacterium sp. C7(2022) TaxID=2992759 RepID=UPI00237B2CC8|nr:tetratricopeptide repeat protein [Microbacterium sp. C7(2022)]MDE0547153.1 tetratricopeptide repeat protein [Microbacterium sp. C7(2022)]
MSARFGVAVMAALLVLYIVLVGQRAWVLLTSGDGIAVTMGIALVVLPAIALWALGREIWFGVRAAALGRILQQQGELPDDEVAVQPSGRIVREDAAAVFPRYREAVERDESDWRAWYRLGLAYDAAGDRRRAREAIRRAIRLQSQA